MSDSAFQDWLVSDSWQDYKQQRAIRDIRSSLDGQRDESRALRSQLSRLQGSMEQRLSRLIRSFDAFVELSDLRADLAGFDEPARTRYQMRQVLAFRAGATPALPATLTDVDGCEPVLPELAGRVLPRPDGPACIAAPNPHAAPRSALRVEAVRIGARAHRKSPVQ